MTRKHVQSTRQSKEPAISKKHKNRKHNLAWVWVGLAALLVAGVVIFLVASQTAGITALSPAQTYEKIQQGAFVLDVRTQEEYDQSHIHGSTLIPLDQLASQLNKLPKDKDIVVVCHSGVRSQNAATLLQQKGFKHVSYLSGGLIAWQAAGYPVQNGTP